MLPGTIRSHLFALKVSFVGPCRSTTLRLVISFIKMTVGLTDLLDLAISPQIGPVNFFHLRNLLHTIVNHFGIGEVEAQQAEVRGPQSLRSSSEASSTAEDSSDSEDDEGMCMCIIFFLREPVNGFSIILIERESDRGIGLLGTSATLIYYCNNFIP